LPFSDYIKVVVIAALHPVQEVQNADKVYYKCKLNHEAKIKGGNYQKVLNTS